MVVIANPVTRRGKGKALTPTIISELTRRGVVHTLQYTGYAGNATELARAAAENKEDLVLCIGGDGTVSEVSAGLVNSQTRLGIIPAGTGDDFAKYLGLPKDPLKALEIALTGTPRKIDAVAANERYFVNVAGSGFDVAVLKRTLHFKKAFYGLFAYVLGVLSAIFGFRHIALKLTTATQTIEQKALLVAVANGRFFGGGMCVAPDAVANDGLLDVYYIDAVARWCIPILLAGFINGTYTGWPFVHHLRCDELTVTASDRSLQLDGEIFEAESVHYKLLPKALTVMVKKELD